jgi:ubiquinone/menaquinone biosynthesis C-methylase UbiE
LNISAIPRDGAPSINSRSEAVRAHFDRLAPELAQWRRRNGFYHAEQTRHLRHLIGEGLRVLEIGSGPGDLLAALRPSRGVGVDLSAGMVALAQARHPQLEFRQVDAHELGGVPPGPYDCIVLSDLVGFLDDVQQCLENLRPFCGPHTRVVVSYFNFLWEPALRAAESIGQKMPTPEQNWLSPDDLRNLLELADFEVVKWERRLLFPKHVPLLGTLLNALGALPLLNRLCLCNYFVARPLAARPARAERSVSVVIPCRNEKGNIAAAVERLPAFGSPQEIIFVDGHSSDGTPEEIRRVMAAHPQRRIRLLEQRGTGKGDAVRLGFTEAQGDVLMILDADLTVMPEDLPKFFDAIRSGKAEFLNGSRLVYPMEREAMRTLNRIANKIFALLFSWLLGQRIKDTLCGTKVISREHYAALAANRHYFGEFDPFGDFDLLFGASKLNLQVMDIPVRYRSRSYGETKISRFRHGWLLLRMVVYAYRKLKFV